MHQHGVSKNDILIIDGRSTLKNQYSYEAIQTDPAVWIAWEFSISGLQIRFFFLAGLQAGRHHTRRSERHFRFFLTANA